MKTIMNPTLRFGIRFGFYGRFSIPGVCTPAIIAGMTLTVVLLVTTSSWAQAVCLPAPRLLTTMPMGGQVGTSVEITITGANFENAPHVFWFDPGYKLALYQLRDGRTRYQNVFGNSKLQAGKVCDPSQIGDRFTFGHTLRDQRNNILSLRASQRTAEQTIRNTRR